MIEIGTRVKVKESEIDGFRPDVARKMRGRVGVVRTHQAFSGTPIVTFPAIGRRKEYQKVIREDYLEVVEGES